MLKTIVLRFTRVTKTLAITANFAGALMVLTLMIIVSFDAIARGVFHAPFRGTYEVVQFSLVLIVFLQLPDVVRVGGMARSDGFLTILQRRKAGIATSLRRIIDAISAIFMGLIAYVMFPEFLEMFHTKDYFGVPGIFTAPWWPVKLAIAVSTSLCAVIFLLKMINAQDFIETGGPAK